MKKRSCNTCNYCQKECLRERKEFPTSVAKAVYEVREKLNLTQKELGERLGMAQAALNMIERGKPGRRFTGEQALAIHRLSGLEIDRFIEFTNDTVLNGDESNGCFSRSDTNENEQD